MEVATMSSDAQRKAASRYLATKKTVTIRYDPAEAGAVSTAAAAAGESTQGYILTAVRQRMERDASSAPKSPAGVLPPEVEDRLE